jgi:hypothetical protein
VEHDNVQHLSHTPEGLTKEGAELSWSIKLI